MEGNPLKAIGDVLKERTIVLKGADAATAMGFTQVPNFLLKNKKLSAGDKIVFAMLLSYAWHNDFCFPGQQTLADDLGLSERSVRTHLKTLEAQGLLEIYQRGQGKTNVYGLELKPPQYLANPDRKKTSGLSRKKITGLSRKKTSGPL